MKVSGPSGFLAANSLFGSYFREIRAQKQQSLKTSSSDEAASVSIDDVRTKLTKLADKISKLRELDTFRRKESDSAQSAEDTEETAPTDAPPTNPQPAPGPASISLGVENSNRPRKFEKQIGKAFRKGFESENDKLLKDSNLHGDVVVTVRQGEEVKNIKVSVDGSTTVGEFVNQVNAQAGGSVTASFREVGRGDNTRLRVALKANPQVPGENPPVEPPPEEDSGNLIGGGLNFRDLSGEAGSLEQELKGVVAAFNQLASFINGGGKDGQGLASTSVDENLLNKIESAFKNSTSKDGRLSFDSFLTVRKDGLITLSSNSFQQAFLEDPDGVVDVLTSAANTVAGPKGLAKEFATNGGKLDKALVSIQVRQAQAVATAEDGTKTETTTTSVKADLAFSSRLSRIA